MAQWRWGELFTPLLVGRWTGSRSAEPQPSSPRLRRESAGLWSHSWIVESQVPAAASHTPWDSTKRLQRHPPSRRVSLSRSAREAKHQRHQRLSHHRGSCVCKIQGWNVQVRFCYKLFYLAHMAPHGVREDFAKEAGAPERSRTVYGLPRGPQPEPAPTKAEILPRIEEILWKKVFFLCVWRLFCYGWR